MGERRRSWLLTLTFVVAACAPPDGAVVDDDDPASWDEVHGNASPLSQPGDFVPDNVGGFVSYDDAPAWDGGSHCTGTFTEGANELKTYIQANFTGVTSIGGYSCRQNTADLSKTSVHGTGRALDIMIRTDAGKADNDVGDPIAHWLIEHATDLGMQYFIWDRTSYNSSRTGTKYRAYTGPNPHVDHIHVELNLAGAGRTTPWFMRAHDPPPTPAPPVVPPPTPPLPPAGGAPLLRSPLGGGERVTSQVTHTMGTALVNFACNPITRANHKGTDFGAVIGTPVYAAAPGTIIRSNDGCGNDGYIGNRCGGGFGNHVIILHASGRATLYAHLSPGSGLPRQGQTVACGDLLGQTGLSGNTEGPHLHFEVRDGVTNATDYFARGAVDPYGGPCSSQTASLWVGGAPGQTCAAPGAGAQPRGDDSAVVRATVTGRQRVAPGTHVTQTWRLRNTGSTTWSAPMYTFGRQSGPAIGPASFNIPGGVTIAPGSDIDIPYAVDAPTTAGVVRITFRAMHGTTAFGATMSLELEVVAPAMPRGCHSATLGRDVASGSCVQVSYPACGQSSCGWYQCNDGAFTCTARSACSDATSSDNAHCTMPAACSSETSCGACAGHSGCAWCRSSSTCVDSAGTCDDRVTSPLACATCAPEGNPCRMDGECCGGSASGPVRCLAGFCIDTSTCGAPQAACTSISDCCSSLTCAPTTYGGSRSCCLRAGDSCTSTADCCGQMTCDGGTCTARTSGQSCASTQDCGGPSYCDSTGTCT